MPKMVCDQPLRVTFMGMDACFRPNTEIYVRPVLAELAKKGGAREVTDEPKAPSKTPEPTEASVTDDMIQAAIQELLDNNAAKAFGADGRPKVRSIEQVLGANIDAKDRDRVWEAMSDAG